MLKVAPAPPPRLSPRRNRTGLPNLVGASGEVDLTDAGLETVQMSILAWIILGLIAGFIASKLVNRQGGNLVLDLVLGVVGAFVGGFLFTRFGAAGIEGFNLYSILVATLGAILVLFIYHALIGRRSH